MGRHRGAASRLLGRTSRVPAALPTPAPFQRSRKLTEWSTALQVLTGGMKGTEGYTNLDAYSQTSCPGSPPAPPPNAPCKNAGQSCNSDSDCCQREPGAPFPLIGSPPQQAKHLMSAWQTRWLPTELRSVHMHIPASFHLPAAGSGPSIPCQGSPKTCGAGAVVSSVASGGAQG